MCHTVDVEQLSGVVRFAVAVVEYGSYAEHEKGLQDH
jgi:hypothetical protein